jgi:hypothetical protein
MWRVEVPRFFIHLSGMLKGKNANEPENFADGGRLQLALRELQVFASSPRFWLTFATVVLIFAISGPFGTSQSMGVLPRFAFWLMLHGIAWSLAVICVVGAKVLLAAHIESSLFRMCIGAIVAAIPIGIALELILWSWERTPPSLAGFLHNAALSLPLSLLFCLLSYLAMNGSAAPSAATEMPQQSAAPTGSDAVPLLDRLKPEQRGAILRLTVEDHYTAVTTSRGRALVLIRFADAMKELGETEGMQVHRSHWVAHAHVAELLRDDGRLTLRLKDGAEVPVSRTYGAAVRAAFSP